jgi:hypothetical protein
MKNAFYRGLKSTDLVLFVVIPSMDLLREIPQQILQIIPVHHPHQVHLPNHHHHIIGHYQIYSISEEDRQIDMVAQVVEIQAHLDPLVVAAAAAVALITLKVGDNILCLMRRILIKPRVLFHIPFFPMFFYVFFSTARVELRIPIGGSIF